MDLDGPPDEACLRAGPNGLIVRRVRLADAEALFPLQASYELEEVVPPGSTLNRASCALALERTLASRVVFLAELDGMVVAKANTNARAFTRDQIGGVYVAPDKRNRGIAKRLVAELAAFLRDEGRAASLFVKKRNGAALEAYRQVGFRVGGDYRITYY
jgi:predicted GNAT family acetyltransferase